MISAASAESIFGHPSIAITTKTNNKKFIKCDYNRDGDSYRSPWSNQFFPEIDDGFMPPDSLRAQELAANKVFDAYRQLYFEGGVSSVYFWELDDTAFAGAFLVKKGKSWCCHRC
jgi:capping protein beta